jgi:hypothetical protein
MDTGESPAFPLLLHKLVGALGVTKTEGLKSGISTLGLLLTVLWLICIWGAYWGGVCTVSQT